MMDIWLSILGTAILCCCLYLIYLQRQQIAESKARLAFLVEKVTVTEKNLTTLAKVIAVYEEETKILQKRKEQSLIRERMTAPFSVRNPR